MTDNMLKDLRGRFEPSMSEIREHLTVIEDILLGLKNCNAPEKRLRHVLQSMIADCRQIAMRIEGIE